MASKTVHTGNYSCYLRIDYNFAVSGRSWTLTGSLIFNTGTASMGTWSNTRGNYLTTDSNKPIENYNNLPYTNAGTDVTVIATKTIATGTYDNAGNAPSVTVYWKWGVNSSWGGMAIPSGETVLTGANIGYAAPSYTGISSSEVSRTSVRLKGTVETHGAGITGGGWDISTDGGASWTYYGGGPTDSTITGLTPNTQYWYRGYVTTSGGGANSSWGTFTTSGNAPTATGLPISNITRTSAYVSINGTYDTNASWGGWECVYGTTTNYGSSTSGTMSNLSANTKYYVRGRFYDNWNRWSNYVYNEFTTSGNAPTINSVSSSPSRTSCSISYSATYDNNASYNNISIRYGTTTNYGNTSSSTNLTGLTPNTTYYYSVTITDNWGRTSSAKTGSFKTTSNAPTFNKQSIKNVDIYDAELEFSAIPDTNVSISKYTLYSSNGAKIAENTTGIFVLSNLESEHSYSYYCIVTDSANKTTQSSTLTFETLASKFVHYIDKNNNKLVRLVALGDLKNFINHMNLEIGGLSFAVGRSYALACTNSTSTTSMRSNLIPIADTTLNKNQACFIQSTLFSWKIQHYDSNGNGISEKTGNIGEAAVINFSDMNGYIAIEISSTNIDKINQSTKVYGCGTGDLNNILDNKKKINKTITPTDLVKVSKYMRYIDVGQSGSNMNDYSHIVELEVYDVNGINRARGIIPTLIKGTNMNNASIATDGNTSSNSYLDASGVNTIMRFDLGGIYEISHVKLWRYYTDNRKYYKTFVYGRAGDKLEDNLCDKELCYKFHDYKRDGIYAETSSGKTWYVNKEPEDISKPIINSFTASTLDWTNQGVVLTILAEDDNGTDNLIYSFDGGINWTKNNSITVFKNRTYTAVVKDKHNNISSSNPTIEISKIDMIAPDKPVIIMRYDNENGEEYTGETWTNHDIFVDCKIGISDNLCQNIIEHGYINKEKGIDVSDINKIKEVNKMILTGSPKLYIQKYNYESETIDDGIITIYFYKNDETYLGYKDVDLNNPYVDVINGANYCRLADTSNDINNYYMVAESNEPIPYVIYYHVTDNLSGIKGWYYRISLNDNTYVELPVNQLWTKNINSNLYIVTRDNAGNNSKYITKILKVDKDAPRDVRFSFIKSENSLTLTASAVDDLSGIRGYQFSIDGGKTWTDEQNNNVYTFNDLNGIYDVMVRVYDLANNYTNSEYQVIAVGDTSLYPSVDSVDGNPTIWTNKNVTLSINGIIGTKAPAGTTISKYSFDNGKTWSANKTKTFSENGLIYIRVEDSNGNKSDTYVIEINKIDKIPPTLNLPIEILQIPVGNVLDLWNGVTYYDNDSGINEDLVTVTPDDTSTLNIGEQQIEYSITDNAGNTTVKIRTVNVIGSVPADTLYPRDDIYPDNLSLPNSELSNYTHRQLSQYKLSDIRGGNI